MAKFLAVACWILIVVGVIAGAWIIVDGSSGQDFFGRKNELTMKTVAVGLAVAGYHFVIGATAGIVSRMKSGESVPLWLAKGAEGVGSVLLVGAAVLVLLGVTKVANLGILSNESVGKSLIPAAILLFYNSVLAGMAIVAGRAAQSSSGGGDNMSAAPWPLTPEPPPGTTVCLSCKAPMGKIEDVCGACGMPK